MIRPHSRLRVELLEDRDVPSTVTNLLDDGSAGTLRSVIAATPAGGVVDFAPGLTGTIRIGHNELLINKDLTIAGPGAGVITVLGGAPNPFIAPPPPRGRVFNVDDRSSASTLSVAISGLTITGGVPESDQLQRPPRPPIRFMQPGGGVYNAENLTLTDVVVTGNSGTFGGGVYNFGTLTVVRGAITNNRGHNGGGLAAAEGTTTRLVGVTFRENSAYSGGGVHTTASTLTADRCSFERNLAGFDSGSMGIGGGLSVGFSTAATLTNCTFSANAAHGRLNTLSGGGGGIISFGNLNLVNCTITGNEERAGSGGGGVRVIEGVTVLSNTILAGNTTTAADLGPDVRTTRTEGSDQFPEGQLHATASLIGVLDGAATLSSSTANIVGTPAAPVNPRLAPLADRGGPTRTHALLAGSPAIDAGSNELAAGLATDQRGAGFPRVANGHADIGAYEVGVRPTAVGAGPGGGSRVTIYGPDGIVRFSVLVFAPTFLGGVRVAAADVTGDGVEDAVAGAGPGGGPHVKVLDGATGQEVASFFAFEPGFAGGVNVGTADLDGDGVAEVLVGAGAGGGPHVRAFRFAGSREVASFFAFDPAFRGGVSVAGDAGFIVAGAGPGGAPEVRVFDAGTLARTASFLAFAPDFGGGVSVTADAGLIGVGAGPGGAPHVKAFSPDGIEVASFVAFDPEFRGGVNVASRGVGDRVIWVGAGPGGLPQVRGCDLSGAVVADFLAFGAEFRGGVVVG